jgi:hypothetical protein
LILYRSLGIIDVFWNSNNGTRRITMAKKKIEEPKEFDKKKLFDEKETLENRIKKIEELFQKLADRHGWV